jgi:hypothetical protein
MTRLALKVEQIVAIAAAVAAIAVALSVPHKPLRLYEKTSQAEEDAYWTVSGPPCTPMSGEAFDHQLFHPDLHGFDFQGVRVSYAFGGAECREYGDRRASYRRCMFSGPGVIRVILNDVETVYIPGIGHPATISVINGKLSCVLASHNAFNPPDFGDEAAFDRTHPFDGG